MPWAYLGSSCYSQSLRLMRLARICCDFCRVSNAAEPLLQQLNNSLATTSGMLVQPPHLSHNRSPAFVVLPLAYGACFASPLQILKEVASVESTSSTTAVPRSDLVACLPHQDLQYTTATYAIKPQVFTNQAVFSGAAGFAYSLVTYSPPSMIGFVATEAGYVKFNDSGKY